MMKLDLDTNVIKTVNHTLWINDANCVVLFDIEPTYNTSDYIHVTDMTQENREYIMSLVGPNIWKKLSLGFGG